jgi:hypothetical protein
MIDHSRNRKTKVDSSLRENPGEKVFIIQDVLKGFSWQSSKAPFKRLLRTGNDGKSEIAEESLHQNHFGNFFLYSFIFSCRLILA